LGGNGEDVAVFGAVQRVQRVLPRSAAAEQSAGRGGQGAQGEGEAASAAGARGSDDVARFETGQDDTGAVFEVLYGQGAAQSARLLLSGVGGTSKSTTIQAQAVARQEGLEVTRNFGKRSDPQVVAGRDADADSGSAAYVGHSTPGGILCSRFGDLMVGICHAVSSSLSLLVS